MDFELLASGYGLVEGPRVDEADRLYFSDVVKGGVHRREPDGTVTNVVPKRRGVGGIALHAEGGLVISGRNVCHVKDGSTRVVFEREDIPGFNDLFTDAEGRVYVGSLRADPFSGGSDRKTGELYRLAPGGQVDLLYGDVSLSNGVGFSPDGRSLYHSDSARGEVIVHDLDGSEARNRRAIPCNGGAPDGLAVDEEGCVWVALYGGGAVQRYHADGRLERTVEVPANAVTSLCFGGADRRDLYVVSADHRDEPDLGGSIFRARVDVPGLPAPLATI